MTPEMIAILGIGVALICIRIAPRRTQAMSSNGKNRKLVVVQLSGGNDYLNCVVPYTNPNYIDNRPNVRISQDDVIPLDDQYGFNPSMGPIKDLFDQGKVAVIHGVGYPVPNRSHFRSMDIWHTAEPTKVGDEGWLGQVVREMHPDGDNVVAAVNFGIRPIFIRTTRTLGR